MILYTVGHSNRSIEEFVALLWAGGVAHIADVRRHPGSRKYPHFNPEPLAKALGAAGIGYGWHEDLGGRRKSEGDGERNGGWRNASFRAYASYLSTPQFDRAARALMKDARGAPTAIMCSEGVPWRCHRWLISDAMTVRGVHVFHLTGASPRPHRKTAFLRVRDGVLTYPPGSKTAHLQ